MLLPLRRHVGFSLRHPFALLLRKPLIPLSKPGKLPYRTYSLKYDLEYGMRNSRCISIGVSPRDWVLMIRRLTGDGWNHAGRLSSRSQKAGGVVAGCAFLVELGFLKGREQLKTQDVFSLIQF